MKQYPKTLIVEDSDLQAECLEETLNEFGISDITKAGDGIKGLDLFEHALQEGYPYSLVFIDIVMPEMDGQELLKRIRTLEKAGMSTGYNKSIIIMVTALNTPKDMMEAIISGDCDDYIVKPVDQDDLRGMLKKYEIVE